MEYLLSILKRGSTVFVVTLKTTLTANGNSKKQAVYLAVNSDGMIENITFAIARFLKERLAKNGAIITSQHSEIISYLSHKLFNDFKALIEVKL